MKNTFLFLSILGAIVPYLFFFDFFQTHGLDFSEFVLGLIANGPAAGFSADLFISSFVFWIYMFAESNSGRGPAPWLFIALNLTIGLSCAFPAYLYFREVN